MTRAHLRWERALRDAGYRAAVKRLIPAHSSASESSAVVHGPSLDDNSAMVAVLPSLRTTTRDPDRRPWHYPLGTRK